jgi:hypothetical protein
MSPLRTDPARATATRSARPAASPVRDATVAARTTVPTAEVPA